MLIIPDEVVTGALVNAVAVVGRQISKAVVGLRTADDLTTARWFETFGLTGTLPDRPDLSPALRDELAAVLSGREVQAALQELLAVRLTDAPETDASRACDAVRLAVSAVGPAAGRFAEALAGYYDDQICSLVARLEAQDPPLLAQIRSEAFSARMISILHAIERHTAALADEDREHTAGRAETKADSSVIQGAQEIGYKKTGRQMDQWLDDLTDLNRARDFIDESLRIEFQRRILSRRFYDYYENETAQGGSDE